jgi:hypothetical protein
MAMTNRFAPLLMAYLLSSASAALAQPAPSPPAASTPADATVGGVTVLGRRPQNPQSFSSAVSGFVRSHAHESPIGNLTRWIAPVCPATVGLSPAMDAFVTKRVLEIADQVKAPHSEDCRTVNVLVVFTPEPQKLVDNVRADHAWMLGYHYATEEKALTTFHGPVEAWRATGTKGWTGLVSLDDADPPCLAIVCFGRGWFNGSNSRLSNLQTNEFMFVLIVADSAKVDGQAIGTVADEIAALALSDPGRRIGCSPLPSVLDGLDMACPDSAPALTAYDAAFLKALYASDPENLIELQRSFIADSIYRDTRPAVEAKTR